MSKIDCKYSLHTHNNQWGVRGSRRGIFGSFFDKCDTQYTIYVSKKDFLSASKILEKRKMVE